MDPFEDDHGQRFILQHGEFVPVDQARAYGSASEIIADHGMYRKDQLTIDLWLRGLWDWAVATDEPMSDLLANDYYERKIISKEEYAHYQTVKFFRNELSDPS